MAEIDRDQVEDKLIDALHRKRWQPAIAELLTDPNLSLDARELVESAAHVTEEIAERTLQERERAVSLLKVNGIDCQTSQEPHGIAPTTSVTILEKDVDEAVKVLESAGYLSDHRLSPGAEQARRRIDRTVAMVPTGAATARLELTWSPPGESRGALGPLTPRTPDLLQIGLPAWAWPAYWLVRPFRLLIKRIRGISSGENLGPYFSTPVGMIPDLLDTVSPAAADLVVDLGCGDGRVLIAAAQLYGCRGRGIESDDGLVDEARRRVLTAGLQDRVEVVAGDAVTADLSDATIVFIFMPAGSTARLLPSVLERLAPGGKVIAHEQAGVNWPSSPMRRKLILHPSGVTVAYMWKV